MLETYSEGEKSVKADSQVLVLGNCDRNQEEETDHKGNAKSLVSIRLFSPFTRIPLPFSLLI